MVKYVDYENKTCIFGYGGIAVSSGLNTMCFSGIDKALGAGTVYRSDGVLKVGDWKFTGERLSVSFKSLKEVDEFKYLLDRVNTLKGGNFEFKGITFDFSKYSKESIDIVLLNLNTVKNNIVRCSAS